MVFWDEDIRDILRIPLAVSTIEDTRIWNQHKRGYYTVRTAYYLFRDLKKLHTTIHTAGPCSAAPMVFRFGN